ncbi:serine protease [Xylanibacter ruminicola]|nr:serine protease [Xylanibacter ruminicola]
MAKSQPSWVKKATKSVFTLKTFADDGSLIGSSNGFFTSANGDAVSNYTPFKGASRAVVIDATGKELPVVSIVGVNDMYDVVKFRVSGKTQPLIISSTTTPVGSQVWLLPYHEVKNVPVGTVRKAETFQKEYEYYTIAMTMPANTVSTPLINQAGEVVGMMQQPANDKDTLNYAVSARFADSLKISGFGMNEATLLLTKIKKELPDNIKDAVLALYMASSRQDSATYASLVEDFIQKFPKAADGYLYRAQLKANENDFAAAENNMEIAIKNSTQKDDIYYNYARMIYNKNLFRADKPYDSWSLDKALEQIRLAYTLNPQPTYRQLEANILFGQKKYNEAYDIFMQLTSSNLNGPELYFSAARCKEMLKDSTAMLALLDSTMNCFTKPYLKEAAPYLWARAQARMQAKKYREAVADMNDYEELMMANINDNFYYIRHQAEVEGRLYQQALNDITRAIVMNPKESFYYAEKASLEVRVGLYDKAIATAKESLTVDPNDSDGYLFLGVAQCLKGNKKEGIANLQKAKELGNLQADKLIEKYK